MILKVLPSTLSGDNVWAPPSKSIMQRALALATFAEGTTMLRRPSESDDCTQAMMMSAQLGATLELDDDAVAVNGVARPAPRTDTLTPGESGLGARTFGTLAALHDHPIQLGREGTLAARSFDSWADALRTCGAEVDGQGSGESLSVKGPMLPGVYELDAKGTSQVITGLLCSLPLLEGNSQLTVHNVVSTPYMEMTLEMMEDFGLQVEARHLEDSRTWILNIPGNQRAQGVDMTVDGDWSGAAFLLGLGLLCAPHSLTVEGLASSVTQADEAIKGALLFSGCRLAGVDDGIQIFAGKPKAFQVDLTDCPDLFPPLAAMAVFAKKPSAFKGLHRLDNKESNRGLAIQEEWGKLGIQVDLDEPNDTLRVHPGKLQAGRIDPRGDHRMAMAASILGAAGAAVEILDAECVAKSYPAFFDDLEALGVAIQVVAK
jgi:3-phosphoshikimate 1-carboxyvinyltransferase